LKKLFQILSLPEHHMALQLIAAGKVVLLAIAALLPIVNPLGNAPIFLAMTSWCATDMRQALARRIALNGFILLLIAIFVGSHILAFFGISVPVVQVGGGLLVAAAGWRLLDSRGDDLTTADATPWSPDEVISRAFYPLTLPLTVGPGSISVAITLGANTTRTHIALWALITAIVIAVTLVAVSIYFCYRFAENMARLLGRNGTSIFLRLSSFILLCIGVQIFWNGASALLGSLPKLH
jgi:multiple antibiotic resistance protein